MSSNKSQEKNLSSGAGRASLAFAAPIGGGVLAAALVGGLGTAVTDQSAAAVLFAGLGLVSWFIGLRWYGLTGMGLRGKRPLYSSIGFATLGWVAFLLLRFFFVRILGFGPPDSGRSFLFLLLFEAFAVQLWVFGLLFRALADWRGPMTAAIGSGIVFGAVAYLLFRESFTGSMVGFLHFVMWGILLGIIRLRTGSILGSVVVQALQSFTAWTVMVPEAPPLLNQLQTLYITVSVAFLILIWRLWPKVEGDYRI